ncbi:MAG: ABC transporter ATP-binding protein [Gordonia sp. (in: high G+C Gram-positive bacteria)]
MTNILQIRNLNVSFGRGRAARHVVKNVSLSVAPGECLAIVGESGSGKSVTAASLVGLHRSGHAAVSADSFVIDGSDVTEFTERQWRGLRGATIGFVLQDALGSLDPVRTVSAEVAEPLIIHRRASGAQARNQVPELLSRAGIPDPHRRAAQRPYQLSGGLRQRTLIASAVALDPPLVIADEPTTALDVTVARRILELFEQLRDNGTGLILVSHDISVVAAIADRIAVMRAGEIVETGPTQHVLNAPQHNYTRTLLASVIGFDENAAHIAEHTTSRSPSEPLNDIAVTVDNVSASLPGPDRRPLQVLSDISFHLHRGHTLGIVGESGSGKTTLARIILGRLQPDTGHVTFHERHVSATSPHPPRAAMVFQNPLGSFDPRWSALKIVEQAICKDAYPSRRARRDRAMEILESVGLTPDLSARPPRTLSGGQRQRIAIARALAQDREVVILDEPTSALDATTQTEVLGLLTDLTTRHAITFVLISHNVAVIARMADHVLVLKDGRIVEQGATAKVFTQPTHDYTRELLAAVPRLSSSIYRLTDPEGTPT